MPPAGPAVPAVPAVPAGPAGTRCLPCPACHMAHRPPPPLCHMQGTPLSLNGVSRILRQMDWGEWAGELAGNPCWARRRCSFACCAVGPGTCRGGPHAQRTLSHSSVLKVLCPVARRRPDQLWRRGGGGGGGGGRVCADRAPEHRGAQHPALPAGCAALCRAVLGRCCAVLPQPWRRFSMVMSRVRHPSVRLRTTQPARLTLCPTASECMPQLQR